MTWERPGRTDHEDPDKAGPVTVVHDYLTQQGGAERVAILLAHALGGGAITTSAYLPTETFPEVGELKVRQLLPWLPSAMARRRATLGPLAGLAFLAHRVDEGVVVCSTSGWAHWLRGRAPRVVYCHTPARWLYEPRDYFKDLPGLLRGVLTVAMAPLRAIDRQRIRTAAVVLANGPVTAQRINRVYGIEASVLIPPPGIDAGGLQQPVPGVRGTFYLTVSRPRAYKNLDLVTSVFAARRQEQLVVVGGTAGSATDEFIMQLGRVSDAQLRWLYQNAHAVICVAREDLGLVPIEAFQFGTPAVALRAGGYLATCTPGRNAVFVESEDSAALNDALNQLLDHPLDRAAVRQSAQDFTVEQFRRTLVALVADAARTPEHSTRGKRGLFDA